MKQSGPTALHILYVTWQDPNTKRYWPVGRLRVFEPTVEKPYEFVYLQGARQARSEGFHGFVGFPDQDRVYRDNVLFPLFANRLMPRSRPDFSEFVTRLDLDPNTADDLDILARSGGRRSTDSLEVFAKPDLVPHGCYMTYFLAHGVRYLHQQVQQLLTELSEGDRLFLQWDQQNLADHRAMSLRTKDHVAAGFVPRYLLDDVWDLQMGQDSCGWPIEISVAQINPAPAPVQQRLVCRMEACWPDGFSPYNSEEYQPVPISPDVN